jgi:hypothetical protein
LIMHLSALHDLDARIDRVVALRADKEHVWQAREAKQRTKFEEWPVITSNDF